MTQDDETSARARLRLAAWVAVPVGLYAWAAFALAFRHDGLIAPAINAPGVDFMVFWQGARWALAGDLGALFDGARFTAALNHDFAGWLREPLPFHPWLYPPHFLLPLLPLAVLPFGAAYALFIAASLAALLAAVLAGEGGRRRAILAGATILSPAVALDAAVGQNALLIGALLIGGFRLIEQWPALAGILLGLATMKPQLALMVPVALIAARAWRALAWALASTSAAIVASVLAFGVEPWRDWIAAMLDPANPLRRGWSELSLRYGESVYAAALSVGGGSIAALLAQAGASVFAAVIVALAWRRPYPPEIRLAVLLAATIVAAPHVAGYDLTLLAVAAGLTVCRALEEGRGIALALIAWLTPLYGVPATSPLGLLAPGAAIALMLAAAFTPARCGAGAGTSA